MDYPDTNSIIAVLVTLATSVLASLVGVVKVLWGRVSKAHEDCETHRKECEERLEELYIQLASKGVVDRRRTTTS